MSASTCSHLAMVALLCDAQEDGSAVTRASLANGLKGLPAPDIQQRLLAHGVESSLESCADLQVEVAHELEQRAAAVVQTHDEHSAPTIQVEDGSLGHELSVGRCRGAA
jgi:hypothetical protein